MSGRWRKMPNGGRKRHLGHGLMLRIDPYGDKEFVVTVFRKRLVTPSTSIPEAKFRAEQVARRWLQEALLRTSGRFDD